MSHLQKKEKYARFTETLKNYKSGIQAQLTDDCQKVIDMIEINVLAKPCDGEAKCYFVKMVADYYRYMTENVEDESVKLKALAYYE